jgi:ribosome-associated heat shock protein Hsp15
LVTTDTADSIRIDKWLFYARFYKTRTLAADIVTNGRIRLNSRTITKPAVNVRVDDVLTIPMNKTVLVIRVLDLGQRRGSASEAQKLYEHVQNEHKSIA